MRVLEAKATKEAERKLSRRLVLEVEEGQLMEERKKRKDDKRKKESAQKKTAEQKKKGSEPAKPSVSQPVIASITSPSTVASSVGGNNNAKRAVGNSQQQVQQQPPTPASRYPPREVPPRFRHQEQKQLLKRGQPLPGITANLGSASKLLNGQPGGGPGAGETPATGGGEGQSSGGGSGGSSSPKQPDPNHGSALGTHHESSPWGPVSSSSDSSPNWDQVTDGDHHPREESWPSAANASDSEPASSECMDTFESGSSSGSERNHVVMASRGHSGEASGLQEGSGGHSGQAKPAGGSNHMGKGGVGKSWGLLSFGPASADVSNGTAESSHSRMDAGVWGALGLSNGEIHPSTLNSKGHPRVWPGLVEATGSGGSSGSSTAGGGQLQNPRGTNSNPGGSWNSPQENCEPHLNGTRKMPRGGQNPNPDMSGPNHTTNFTTSSLPNPAGSGQANEAVSSSQAGGWGLNARSGRSAPQACLVVNGTSASHQGHGEAQNGAAPGTAWGPTYSGGDSCSNSSSHATSDTVNAPQRPPGLHGAVGSGFDIGGEKGPWEGTAGTGGPQKSPWERGLGPGPRGGGQRGRGQSSDAANHEWSKPSAHPPLCEGGNGKKFTSLWQAVQAEEEKASTDPAHQLGFPASHGAEQKSGWTQPRTGENAGQPEGPEEKDGLMTSQERRKVDLQALLQSIVSRADLDPRVLSNTGWGQTPIKQNTAWDTALSPRGGRKASGSGTEAWAGLPGAERPGPHRNGAGWGEAKSVAKWGGPKGHGGGSHGVWQEEGSAAPPMATAKGHPSWGSGGGGGKDGRSSCSSRSEAEKLKQGWGEAPKAGLGRATADGWGENSRSNHWGEMTKSSSSSSDSDRSGSGWKEPGKPWSSHNAKPSQSQGWGEAPKPSRSPSWGEAPKPPEVGYWQAPPATSKPQGRGGWLGGPMPAHAKKEEEEEPTGWEEPSPESIRRKIEIDDGTSAWGDPSKYNYKSVNMWNRNSRDAGSQSEPQGQRRRRQQQQQQHQQGLPASTGGSSSGWGEPPPSVSATVDNGTSAWGRPVDTGGSWGEAMGDTGGGGGTWGNPSLGRQASNKPGPKPMQAPDGWYGGGDMPLAGSQQPSWEEDDEDEVEIGMWNSHAAAAAQEANNSNASLHWAPCSKKLPAKSTLKNGNKEDDMWMNPFVKQFANLGFPRESPEEIMQSNKIDLPAGLLPDKWMEMEKHNLNAGDYSRVIGKNPNARPQISKESSMDRIPYFDKEGLVLAEESHNGPFLSHQNAKSPLSNSALPNQPLGSLPGLSMPNLNYFRQNGNPSSAFGNLAAAAAAQSRSLQQPPAQALNAAQPNPRAQVPPPLLSPQVPVSMLKYAPNNGGLSPLFGPQQVAMLNQLSQLNQISQLQRLLAQQRKVQSQRNTPVPGRQQQQQEPPQEPQPQSRSLGLQPPGPLDPALLLKQQLASSQPSLHQSAAVKSFLENAVPHAGAELQKGPPQANNAFSNFPIGLNSNLSVNMDMGSIKEPQSRLRKWMTVDSISTNTSLDPNASKNGAISSGFRLEEAPPFLPYNFMDSSSSPASPLGPIGDGWSRAKSPNGSSSVNWPPEFRPGEPWKGYPNIDPETDPYITPGSVTNNLSVHTVREADHLRDRSSGSSSSLNTTLPSTSAWSSIRASNYNLPLNSTAQSTSSSSSSSSSSAAASASSLARNSDSRPAWSPVSIGSSSSSGSGNTSLAHELWKVPLPSKGIIAAPSRPPPGLTGQKGPLSTWGENPGHFGGGWNHTEARYTPGSSWGESSSGRITNCLVLKNLTPQIDGSTLRTLCMQHGPLMTFHLNLPHGNALVRYSSKEEVVKAQKSLHMCVLGNTTILAEFASEEEISRFFAQGQSLAMAASTAPSPAWQSLGGGSGTPQNHRLGSAAAPGGEGSHPSFPSRSELSHHWNGAGGGDLHGGTSSLWGGNPSYSTTTNLWGSLGGPSSPLNTFLSVDHLGATAGGGESM